MFKIFPPENHRSDAGLLLIALFKGTLDGQFFSSLFSSSSYKRDGKKKAKAHNSNHNSLDVSRKRRQRCSPQPNTNTVRFVVHTHTHAHTHPAAHHLLTAIFTDMHGVLVIKAERSR